MANARTVLLDVDGTLVDSNDAHARAWVEALAAHGHRVPFEKVRSLIGKGGDKLLAETVEIDKDSDAGQSIDQLRSQVFKEKELPGLKPFPAARELLQRMADDGLRLVVATSAKEEEMNALIDIVGVKELLFKRTSSDDADNSKPDPDIVRGALRKAGAKANEAWMLGDTPYDVEAAARAGVQTVALRSGGWGDEALRRAIAIYDDARQLLENYDESPFVR
jgi:HAD superfamily hydrolase (TIGR01509 family)